MRPRTITAIAERAVAAPSSFDRAVREFLDSWQAMDATERDQALADEPVPVGLVQDAYLAALAEHLALSAKQPVPDWTNGPSRFLRQPFFAGGLESLKAILLVESPLAFRRRQIFISANALSRPDRQIA